MLDNKGFDLWADGYDKDVLNTIYNIVCKRGRAKVLDISFTPISHCSGVMQLRKL